VSLNDPALFVGSLPDATGCDFINGFSVRSELAIKELGSDIPELIGFGCVLKINFLLKLPHLGDSG